MIKFEQLFELFVTFNIPKPKTMNKLLTTLLLVALCISAIAQPFAVGTRTFTFNDPARTGGTGSGGGAGRQIESELYYPATAAGANATVAAGKFPVVIFGHGFSMNANDYTQFYNTLAQNGYIVVAPRTETGLSPVHTDFGKDLAIVIGRALDFDTVAASPFFGKVLQKGAIAGHSMGGGCTFLSDQYNSRATCYLTMAPANTNPASTVAAMNISKPMCILSGTKDCVAPDNVHQKPMYDSLFVSPCKQHVLITDARHCSFSNGNSTTCNFGEGVSGCGSSPLTTANQISIVSNIMLPYFNYFLKGICSQWDVYQTYITTTSSIATLQSCNMPVPASATISGDSAICNGNNANLTTAAAGFTYKWSNNSTTQSISTGTPGSYTVTVSNPYCSIVSNPFSVSQKSLPGAAGAITGTDTACANQSGLPFSVGQISGADSYVWTLPNGWSGANLNSNAPTINAGTSSGVISVVGSNACGQGTAASLNIAVVDTPQPILSGNGNTIICNVTGQKYQWYENGVAVGGLSSNNTYNGTAGKAYYVVVTNNAGCSGKSNTISLTNGIEQIADTKTTLVLYPNPASEIVYVTNTSEKDNWQLTDVTGKLISTGKCTDKTTSIKTENLSKGLYNIRVGNKAGKVIIE